MSDQQEVWTAVAQLLRAQLTESVWFSTFSEVVPVVDDRDDHLVIQVPSTLARDRILTRYQPLITDALAELGEGHRRFDVVDQHARAGQPHRTPPSRRRGRATGRRSTARTGRSPRSRRR